jgi:DNA primase
MPGRIPQQFIDDLVARADIVEIIDRRVKLKKAGREFKACCPFHDEKSASFTVSPSKQFFHCFGCGEHGTALGFLMAFDHMTFPEAVEALASEMGVEVPRESGPDTERRGPDLYPAMTSAADFYADRLKDTPLAVDYLKQRGISGETARDFQIGYAPDRWDAVLSHLGGESEGAKLELAGLVIARDGGGHYDRFRGRVMFPIRDHRGRVIGFGGRVIGDGEPKYLNSPETPLFHKGRELYGLYEARQANRELARLLVVEGYMDVVSLAQSGIRYAVATLGTATTPEHLERIFRVTEEVVFCFDGDRAGRQAAWRALENALPVIREGRQIRFLFLPDGQDPDTMVQQEGREAFEERLVGALSLSGYLIEELASQVDLTSVDGRARLLELARPLVARIPEGVYRDLLVEQLSKRAATDVGTLRRALAGTTTETRKIRPEGAHRPRHGMEPGRESPVRRAIRILLTAPKVAQAVEDTGELGGLDVPGAALLVELIELARSREGATTAVLIEHFAGRPDHAPLLKLAGMGMGISDRVDEEKFAREFADTVGMILRDQLEARLEALWQQIATGEASREQIQEHSALKQRLSAIRAPSAGTGTDTGPETSP